MTSVEQLASKQLEAYNRSDLEAFVGCYHPAVRVFDGEDQSIDGIDAFRERYRSLFEGWEFGAAVPQRVHLGRHCIDYETWWRVDPSTGERTEGSVLVRYEERDGLIGLVQFLD